MSGKTKKQAKRLRRWTEDLGEIESQILSADLDRAIWRKVRDGVLNQHPEADAHFLASYSRSYVISQVTRIRAMATERKDPRSIPHLIGSIRKNPDVVSRDAWIETVTGDPRKVAPDAGRFYDRHLGDGTGNLSTKGLREDLKAVQKANEKVSADWTRELAEHLDQRSAHRFHARDLRLEYPELDRALRTLGAVTRRLQLLVRGSQFKNWKVDIQVDWQEPLRTSLFPFEDVSFLLPPSGDFS